MAGILRFTVDFWSSLLHEFSSFNEVTFPAFKDTKHGTVTLVLPARIFWTDLTIHMDVKANPGPGIDKVNVTLWKPSSIRSCHFHLTKPRGLIKSPCL